MLFAWLHTITKVYKASPRLVGLWQSAIILALKLIIPEVRSRRLLCVAVFAVLRPQSLAVILLTAACLFWADKFPVRKGRGNSFEGINLVHTDLVTFNYTTDGIVARKGVEYIFSREDGAPSRIFRCLKGLPALRRSWPNTSTSRYLGPNYLSTGCQARLSGTQCRAGRRGRSQGQGWECSDQWDHAAYRKGNKLLEQFNHNVSGTSAPKAIAASTANVPDGFKILHAQRAAKCARLAEAAAAAAAPATDDA
ncbi:hypothetical protein FB451DRAFT_1378556 [Mycena latifolia]|nr:hypothetical protein FB451DRAFT_1378556 [Mycena latifolia]